MSYQSDDSDQSDEIYLRSQRDESEPLIIYHFQLLVTNNQRQKGSAN